jgi:DNA-damage-inducible protein D
MSNLELIFQMLGEETTRQLAIKRDAQGYSSNENAAKEGSGLAGESLRRLEEKTGIAVVTSRNFLPAGKKKKS